MANREEIKLPAASLGGIEAIGKRSDAQRADMSVVSHLLAEDVAAFVKAVNQADKVDDHFFASTGRSDDECLRLASATYAMIDESKDLSMIEALEKLAPYFHTVQLGRDMQDLTALYPRMAVNNGS